MTKSGQWSRVLKKNNYLCITNIQAMPFDSSIIHWFYIRPKYRRERKVKQYFEDKNYETYLPMHDVYKEVSGKPRKVSVPLISNFLFVRTTYEILKEEKKALETLGMPFMLRMDTIDTTHPIVIPDKVMNDFIRVCENEYSRGIDDVDLNKIKKGDYVEVLDGPFKGVQGYYSRPYKDKCVVVLIDGVGAVCTTYIPPFVLKKIEENT